MKKFFILAAITFGTFFNAVAQEVTGLELGVDLDLSISQNGGIFGLAPKLKLENDNPALAYGPSLRFQRIWANNYLTNNSVGYSVYGGGGFFHYRIENVIYLGVEAEILRTPITYTFINQPTWVPTVFIGGGLSRDFGKVRINAGLLYDVANNPNSPFRRNYFLKKTDASGFQELLPIIYRFTFFFEL